MENKKYEPVLVKGNDVAPQQVEWLWQDKIPLGKISLVVGNPGLGKSFLSLFIAARVSSGLPWPHTEDKNIKIGSVLILADEDDIADTIIPRLHAAEADVSKIHFIKGVKVKDKDDILFFNLKQYMSVLQKAVETVDGVRLIIIDPISAYMGNINTNDNSEVRSVLNPLCEFAAKYKVAVLGISHLNKNSTLEIAYRIIGSMAYTATARATWVLMEDKEDRERKKLLPSKNNIAKNPKGLSFRLRSVMVGEKKEIESAVCEFESEMLEESADEAFQVVSEDNSVPKPRDEAKDWLMSFLLEGAKTSKEVWTEAEKKGFSKKTLDRAKQEMKVRHTYKGSGSEREVMWELLVETDGKSECSV